MTRDTTGEMKMLGEMDEDEINMKLALKESLITSAGKGNQTAAEANGKLSKTATSIDFQDSTKSMTLVTEEFMAQYEPINA